MLAWHSLPTDGVTFISVHLQIEEISRKLRSGDLGIPSNIEARFAKWPLAGTNHLAVTVIYHCLYTGSRERDVHHCVA